MDNFNGYTYQPNMYYQPTVTTPLYQPRWQNPYQNTAIPQYQQPQNQPQVNNNYIHWTQGIEGAKAYNIPNGTTLPLWDSESQTIYIKSVDANGKPSMTILDYVERGATEETKEETNIEYATKEQVDLLNNQFSLINEKLNTLGSYVTKEQFDSLNMHLNDLSGQINDIENRLTIFGKPQNGNQTNTRRGNK